MAAPIITLLTDFGDEDGFVGAVRGVLLSRAPAARLVDLAHHVPTGDVEKAARVLSRAAPCFPPGAVHLVVVDPGVGTERKAVVVEAGGHIFVAPDNGVVTYAVDSLGGVRVAHAITERAYWRPSPSVTFHGRDIFAPVAAALASGTGVAALGPKLATLYRLAAPAPEEAAGVWRGHVIEVDHFGNLITDLPVEVCGGARVRCALGSATLEGPVAAYASVDPGELVLVVGSAGTLEIAVRDGSAARRLGIRSGAPVACHPLAPPRSSKA